MAGAKGGGDRLPVNCGVKLSGDKFVLNYKVGSNVKKKNITWDWDPRQEGKFVARFEAKTNEGDIKFHNSATIDANTRWNLGKPDKSLDDGYYKVKLKKLNPDVQDLTQFFDVAQ